MFEQFPYANFHDLNMDWIIKIAKDFLDQYTHIQEIISNGEQSIQELTASSLAQLDTQAQQLQAQLNAWYQEHSDDIADQLAASLTQISNTLAETIRQFEIAADTKAQKTIATIPADYTTLSDAVRDLKNDFDNLTIAGYTREQLNISGTLLQNTLTNQNGEKVTVQGWTGLQALITPEKHYLVTATGNPAAVIFNSSNQVIDTITTVSLQELTDYEYVAPANAHHIIVNRRYATPVLVQLNNDTFVHDEMSIEGYTYESVNVSGTLIPNTLTTESGPVTNSAWTGLNAQITPDETYLITATGNPAAIIYSSNNEIVDVIRTASLEELIDYEYRAPEHAHHIIVNRRYHNPVLKQANPQNYVQVQPFITATGKHEGDNVITSPDKFSNVIGLHASNNTALSLSYLNYNGSMFKACHDDIAPIKMPGINYIGANHGYNILYQCTSNGHGLTNVNIGQTYNDGTNTWVLLRIPDANHFQMICFDSTVWYRAKYETVPASVTFGSSEKIISSSSVVQLYPSIKNLKESIVRNNEITTIIEQYDILDLGDGIMKVIDYAGVNTNDSIIIRADPLIRVSNAYSVNKYGAVTIYTDITKLKNVPITEIYGSQCMNFASTDLFAAIGSSVEKLQNSVLSITKSTWKNQNKAPSIFIKSSADKSKAFVIAYLNDRTADIADNAGFVQQSNTKMYPMMMDNRNTRNSYSNILLRIPLSRNVNGIFDYVGYAHAAGSDYVFIGTLESVSNAIFIPELDIYGKSMQVVDKTDSITIEQNADTPALKINASDEGYILLKFT